jgi:hypothetical protein
MFQQESGMALITAEDLDDAAQKAVKAYKWRVNFVEILKPV